MKLNWLTLSILGLLSLGIMSFLITFLTRKGYSVSFVLFAIVFILCIAYFFQTFVFSHQTFVIDLKLILLLLIMGILSFFGNLFLYQAANDAPNAGLAVAIVGLQGVVVSLLSVIFLRDKLNYIQIIGIILGILAIFLINAGSKSNDKRIPITKETKHQLLK